MSGLVVAPVQQWKLGDEDHIQTSPRFRHDAGKKFVDLDSRSAELSRLDGMTQAYAGVQSG